MFNFIEKKVSNFSFIKIKHFVNVFLPLKYLFYVFTINNICLMNSFHERHGSFGISFRKLIIIKVVNLECGNRKWDEQKYESKKGMESLRNKSYLAKKKKKKKKKLPRIFYQILHMFYLISWLTEKRRKWKQKERIHLLHSNLSSILVLYSLFYFFT